MPTTTTYEPARLAELLELFGRVWGSAPSEAAATWWYERSPVRRASVLLSEDEGRVVATAAMSFLPVRLRGEDVLVGMPLRVATDEAYRGRGIFHALEAENESRAKANGIRLLLTVPNAASAPVFLRKLGWTQLPSLRVWARPRLGALRRPAVEADMPAAREPRESGVVRDEAYLGWRFRDAPRPYSAAAGDGGYAIVGRQQFGRFDVAVVAATGGAFARPLRRALRAAAGARAAIAVPPPGTERTFLALGFAPTPKTFMVLGRSLDPGLPLPERTSFELGDLDFL